MYSDEELALLGYLNVNSPIHPRRTLDHSRYPTLQGEDIQNRDRDQVVYRHTKMLRLKPRLIMVDQLWMWIIDENTVVTAFPKRWKARSEPAFDRSDILERIMIDLTSNTTKIRSAPQLGHLIMQKCSSTFFPTPIEVDQTGFLDFLKFFETAIGNVNMKESGAFNKLWEHSNKMQSLQKEVRCRKTGESRITTGLHYAALHDQELERQMQAEVSALTNITEETNLLKEIKDIVDELNSMLLIYKQQELVIGSMGNETGDDSDNEDHHLGSLRRDSARTRRHNQIRRSHARLLQAVISHKSDLETLLSEATKTHDALSMLLDLKQKQAGVLEAEYARQETIETTAQGKTLLAFAAVTIVFLPLSFIAAVFSMNAREINGYSRPIWQIMAIMSNYTDP
ncbi:hypothetical protein E8E13_001388 [Curvularia kusanoi]|uniref:Uncharacterized protein n=1 Tax=Curvularia kusanoi TaxID=90978 RepID=A0A9P4T467_CURKU|nr:hypothetical protein E8E13_001388 [Curvularia kusanoi]